jgi:hypothetical protein
MLEGLHPRVHQVHLLAGEDVTTADGPPAGDRMDRRDAATRRELDDAIAMAFPLRGVWVAVTTPTHRIPSHGTDVLAQRYALDLVMPDERPGLHLHPAGTLRSYLIGGRTRDAFGWGQTVHAMADGEIVTVVDDVEEREWLHVVREMFLALRNAVTFRPTPDAVRRLAGNHIVVRHAEAYAFFAHLSPASIAVRPGAVVQEGDLVGRVGHTGNSTLPHLHVQLMNRADPLEGTGVPLAFTEYERLHRGRWERVERGIPARRERIRSIERSAPP